MLVRHHGCFLVCACVFSFSCSLSPCLLCFGVSHNECTILLSLAYWVMKCSMSQKEGICLLHVPKVLPRFTTAICMPPSCSMSAELAGDLHRWLTFNRRLQDPGMSAWLQSLRCQLLCCKKKICKEQARSRPQALVQRVSAVGTRRPIVRRDLDSWERLH